MKRGKNLRVLIADDSPMIRGMLTEIISEIGGVDIIGEASSVASAVWAIREEEPDLVILDLHLPGGSGMDVMNRVSQQDHVPQFVVFTAFAAEEIKAVCYQRGAAYVFDKTTELSAIRTVLEQMGAKHPVPVSFDLSTHKQSITNPGLSVAEHNNETRTR